MHPKRKCNIWAMKVWHSFLGILLCVTLICGLGACNLLSKKISTQNPTGEYTTLVNGQPVKGQWEGQKMTQQAPPQTSGAPEAPPPTPGSDKPPDLSGKWTVGYEFNFKTIKSSMYLEQDGGKLSGHGVDN